MSKLPEALKFRLTNGTVGHIFLLAMVKRLAAFLFVLVIAGQVSAGVCGCIGGESKSKHSCCKRAKKTVDSIQKKSCCGVDCMARQSDRPVQDRRAPQGGLQFQSADEPQEVIRFTFERIAVRQTVPLNFFTNHRLKYERPPELYLRHHAFLI
jgi:hypothetical protein